MKKVILTAIFISIIISISAADAGQQVRGYYRDSNGDGIKDTYVQPYQRTNPNSVRTDNYSYPGNLNPNQNQITPQSSSPRENYPTNPNPYQKQRNNW